MSNGSERTVEFQPVGAQHASRCSDCGGGIQVGDRIVRDPFGDGWRHVRCPDSASIFDLKPTETVCKSCFTVKPCVCDDGL